MSQFIRYTCNKKNVPVLRADCTRCPEYNPCAKMGEWCFAGTLVVEHDPIYAGATAAATQGAAMPVMKDTSTTTIYLGDGTRVDVLKEDIKKQFEEEFYKKSGLFFGA